MTIAGDLGRKATKQTKSSSEFSHFVAAENIVCLFRLLRTPLKTMEKLVWTMSRSDRSILKCVQDKAIFQHNCIFILKKPQFRRETALSCTFLASSRECHQSGTNSKYRLFLFTFICFSVRIDLR